MALLAIPLLQRSLLMTDAEVTRRLEAVMETIRAEHDIVRYLHHVVKTGRTRFIQPAEKLWQPKIGAFQQRHSIKPSSNDRYDEKELECDFFICC
jgi:hypothetical protein